MDSGQNQNPSPQFYKWDGEPPGPAQACLSPFVIHLFPSATWTFHPPAGRSPAPKESRERETGV